MDPVPNSDENSWDESVSSLTPPVSVCICLCLLASVCTCVCVCVYSCCVCVSMVIGWLGSATHTFTLLSLLETD